MLEDPGILQDPCAFVNPLVGAGGRNTSASHSPCHQVSAICWCSA